jgi:ribosomal protein S26
MRVIRIATSNPEQEGMVSDELNRGHHLRPPRPVSPSDFQRGDVGRIEPPHMSRDLVKCSRCGRCIERDDAFQRIQALVKVKAAENSSITDEDYVVTARYDVWMCEDCIDKEELARVLAPRTD